MNGGNRMKIVIVGGVAAGMSAAARARRLSEAARIVVLERSHYVSFANCGLPYHIGGEIAYREQLLLQTPQTLAATLNLDVRTGHEVIALHRDRRSVLVTDLANSRQYEEAYDRLVLCPGAYPVRPPLPGIDHPRIFTLRTIEDMDVIKSAVDGGAKHALVVGGGYIGVEMCENLRHRGLQVDLVELLDQLLPPLDAEMARDLQYHMEYHGVRLHLSNAVKRFDHAQGQVHATLSNGECINTDLVMLAVGVRPDNRLAQEAGLATGPRGGLQVNASMQTSDPLIYAAGDAVEVMDTVTGNPAMIALAGPANRQGRIVAEHILGMASRYTGTQGTSVVKVFAMTAGSTGATEKTLKASAIPYRKIYLHPSGHASYYPGTAPLHMKLVFAPDSGVLLGAQVVGYDGVDKRLDVLAVALRAGLTVFDLQNLELAYAPPYGAAKDPVNMAGFIASNLLQGDISLWYAEEFANLGPEALLVDVRSTSEYKTWHIDGAVNIPLAQLRERMTELPASGAVRLYCRVGFRSYLAYRVLVQSGYRDVKFLAGGSKTFCSFHRTPLCTGEPGIPFVPHAEDLMAERQSAKCGA